MTSTTSTINDIQDNILKQYNQLAGIPIYTKYNSDRITTIISSDIYLRMVGIAEDYARFVRNNDKSYNSMWAFDVIHRYFKMKN